MKCKHLEAEYTCSLGLFEGTPDPRDCANCLKYEAGKAEDEGNEDWKADMPSRGLGDTVAKITNAVGIKPCGGCKKRQEALNKKFKYGRLKKKGGCGCKKKDTHGTDNVTDTPDDGQENS
mgnify:CR=1 FL=1